MATELSCPAGPCSDDLKSDLVTLVHQHNRAVIDAELHRLARRVPSLSRDDLNVIDAVLEELAESSILAQLRKAPQDAVPLLTRLFGTRFCA
jgi:hypothetical protein